MDKSRELFVQTTRRCTGSRADDREDASNARRRGMGREADDRA